MNTVALIPLRGGSKSIPRKNIEPLAGKPLCYWVCKAATEAKSIEKVYVSTDDDEIKQVVESFGLGIEVVTRPADLATDNATTDAVMLHFASVVPDFKRVITIQATSPLTSAQDLDKALAQFDARHLDSMLTGVRVKRFFWNDNGTPLNYDYRTRPMRQQFAGTIMENGAFYITTKDLLLTDKNRLGGTIGIYEMSGDAAVELDEPEDWPVVEALLRNRRAN